MRKRKAPLVPLIIAVGMVALAAGWLFRTSRSSSSPAATAGTSATSSAWSRPGPQAKLPSIKLWLGSQELVAEVARQLPEIYTGLMFRTNLGLNEGMIFVLPSTQQAAFYMRNTLIPLSCAYLDDEGIILEVHELQLSESQTVILYYEDPAEEFEFDAVLSYRDGCWQALPDESSYRLLREDKQYGSSF